MRYVDPLCPAYHEDRNAEYTSFWCDSNKMEPITYCLYCSKNLPTNPHTNISKMRDYFKGEKND